MGPGATVSVTVGFHPAEAGAHMCDATLFYFEVAGDPWMPRPRAILAEVVGLTGLSGRSSVTFREIFAVGQEGVILRPDNHF